MLQTSGCQQSNATDGIAELQAKMNYIDALNKQRAEFETLQAKMELEMAIAKEHAVAHVEGEENNSVVSQQEPSKRSDKLQPSIRDPAQSATENRKRSLQQALSSMTSSTIKVKVAQVYKFHQYI